MFANKWGQVILGDNAMIRTNNKSTSATAFANVINAEAGKQVNTEGGKISLLGEVNTSTAKATAWAISSTGLGSEMRSWNPDASTDTAGLFAIEGNIRADNQRVITLSLRELTRRAYLKGHNAIDDDKNREFQLFVEANWIHNTHNQRVQMGPFRMKSAALKISVN